MDHLGRRRRVGDCRFLGRGLIGTYLPTLGQHRPRVIGHVRIGLTLRGWARLRSAQHVHAAWIAGEALTRGLVESVFVSIAGVARPWPVALRRSSPLATHTSQQRVQSTRQTAQIWITSPHQ